MLEKRSVTVGLHQESSVSPYMFNLVFDMLIIKVQDMEFLSRNFTVDVAKGEESRKMVDKTLEEWRKAMEDGGLRISRQKMQYLWFGGNCKEGEIRVSVQSLKRVKEFNCFDSFTMETGGL